MVSHEELVGEVSNAEKAGMLSTAAAAVIRRWLTDPPFAPYLDSLRAEISAGRWRELDDAFYEVLEFGTGGRRGRMYPVGTNVLNDRTIAESARGLADYVSGNKRPGSPRKCVVAYDTRHQSRHFAELSARVLAAAGFQVHLFREPRATPMLSAAVRYLGCDAGIMISASHNPPSDNGFKCYSSTGGQVIPPDDEGIIACVKAASAREIPQKNLDEAFADGSIAYVAQDVEEHYLNSVVSESVSHARGARIVYTPMHGVGESAVAAALQRAGFTEVTILESERTPDGNFPNIPGHVANPEIPRTLEASIAKAREIGADLVLASDPDADRVGVAVPVNGDPKGQWITLDGNQIGALLTAFVIKQTEAQGKLRHDHFIVTTLVSGQMACAIAQREGVRVENDLLVGFKWIAQRVDDAGHVGFLFGLEESHGYLKGDYARDKDAAVASLLFAELAATVKDRQQTVLEYLDDLYVDVGHYGERQINKVMEGRHGAEKIDKLMESLREIPPSKIGGMKVLEIRDYKLHETRRADGSIEILPEPAGDLLIFQLSSPGCRFAVRPSGTEPKIKFYLYARTDARSPSNPNALAEAKAETRRKLDLIASDLDKYIQGALVETAVAQEN